MHTLLILTPRTKRERAGPDGTVAKRDGLATNKPRRGRPTSPEERATAAALETSLHAAGVKAARVAAVATKPGATSDVRIEHVPIDKLHVLAAALTKRRRAR